MKRLLSILFLICILANVAGFYVYFYFRLKEIKQEMQAELIQTSPELLTRFKFSLPDYKKVKEGDDEIKLNDVMFDIASIQFKQDSVEIFALEDKAESDLLLLMTRITQAISRDSKTPPSELLQYQDLNFTLPLILEKYLAQIEVHVKHHSMESRIYQNIFKKISTPPPRG